MRLGGTQIPKELLRDAVLDVAAQEARRSGQQQGSPAPRGGQTGRGGEGAPTPYDEGVLWEDFWSSGSASPAGTGAAGVTGHPDGSSVNFTLDYTPIRGKVQLFVNGQALINSVTWQYTVSGAVLTFAAAPATTDVFSGFYLRDP